MLPVVREASLLWLFLSSCSGFYFPAWGPGLPSGHKTSGGEGLPSDGQTAQDQSVWIAVLIMYVSLGKMLETILSRVLDNPITLYSGPARGWLASNL